VISADWAAVVAVVNRYAEACDHRRWDLFAEVFTTDVTVEYDTGTRVEGLQALVRQVRGALQGCGPTQHLLGTHTVATVGDEASSRCSVRAFHAGAGGRAGQTYELFGEYHDHLVRQSGGWRIARRRMDIIYEVGSRAVLGTV
jgi:3-phenylpropionate/cinnamic acid dioxygenase small subunit